MATFVKATKIENASSGTASASVAATAGNALMVVSADYGASAPTLTVSGGGTWTTDAHTATDAGTGYTIGLASCPSATGGANTITVAWSAGSANTSFCLEFTGMANPVLDAVGTTNAATSANEATASQTNSNASDVMVGTGFDAAGGVPTYTPNNSWTIPTNGSETNSATYITGWAAYRIVSSSASQNTTVTNGAPGQSVAYYTLIAAYKQAGGGPTTYPLTVTATQAQTPTTPILARRTVVGGTPTYHWDDATAHWDSGPIWDAQTAAHTGSATQTQTLSLARVLSLLRTVTATQTQALALQRQVRLARSLAQSQALALVRQIALVRANTQSQTVGLTLRQSLARTLTATQAQALALGKQVALTRALGQTQALSLAAQKVFLRTLALTQAQVASVVPHFISGGPSTYPITRSVTQAQAVAVSLHQTLFRTLTVAQAQALTLVKQPQLTRLLNQTQSASVATSGGHTYLITVTLSGAYSPPIAVPNASNAVWASNATSVTSSPTFASTAGNLLIAGTVAWGGAEVATPVTNVGGDTWARAGAVNSSFTNARTGISFAPSIHGNAAEAATYTISVLQFPTIVLLEASGCDATAPNDIATTFATATSASSLASPLITPAAGEHLLVVVAQNTVGNPSVAQTVSNNGTGAATWTVIQNNTSTGEPIMVAYAIVIADGSSAYGVIYNPGVISNMVCGIAAFKAGVATGGGGGQGQTVSLVTQNVFGRIVSATQAQAVALLKQARLIRSVAQAQSVAVSLHQALARTLVATQTQALTLVKQSRLARLLGQIQAASLIATLGARTYTLGGATTSHQSLSLSSTYIPFVVPPPPVPVGVESQPPPSGSSTSNYLDWPVLVINSSPVGPPSNGGAQSNYADAPVIVVHPTETPPPIGDAIGGP